MRRFYQAAALAAAMLLVPVSADAATVSEATDTGRQPETRLRFDAAPGEANDITVKRDGDGVLHIADGGAPIVPGAGCHSAETGGEVLCARADEATWDLGDGDDRIVLASFSNTVSGGPGDDHIVGSDWSERLDGGDGSDVIDGGGGTDYIQGDDEVLYPDRLSGGTGGDTTYRGDTLTFSTRSAPVTIDLARGVAGSGDAQDVIDGFEDAEAYGGGDVVIGDERRNILVGHTVVGNGGDDVLYGANVDGGAGADTIHPAGNGQIRCGVGTDVVFNNMRSAAGALLNPDCELWSMYGDDHSAFTRVPLVAEDGVLVVRFQCPVGELTAGICDGRLWIQSATAPHVTLGRAHFRVRAPHARKIRVPTASVASGTAVRVRLKVDDSGDLSDAPHQGAYTTVIPTSG